MAPLPAVQPREFVRAKVAWRKTRQRTGAAALAGGVQIRGATAFRLGARGLRRQTACKPGSVPARGRRWPFICDARHEAPGATDPDDCAETRLPVPPSTEVADVSSLFGLAPGGVYLAVAVAGDAVRSYRTFSPLPASEKPGRRSALCGTVPGVAPAGRYPAPCFRGARTFLPRMFYGEGGHPAVWPP